MIILIIVSFEILLKFPKFYQFFLQILNEIARSFPCLSRVPLAASNANDANDVPKARYILNFETQRTYARSLLKQQNSTSSENDDDN